MSANTPTPPRVALIGFGEAGGILATDLAAQGLAVSTYDRLLAQAASRAPLEARAGEAGVRLADSAAAAAEGADWVISAVTAGSALDVARQLAPHLQAGQLFIDINSVAPNTKRSARDAIEAAGASYIDAAVMAPVPPKRLQTPILLGGRRAAALLPELAALGMNVRAVSEEVGVASAIKMCRSILIKGLEALTAEAMTTARRYGAEAEVLRSLHQSFPEMGWDGAQPHYLISRIAEHGRRRAEEMEEVAKTAGDVGVIPHMSQATVHAQRGLVDAMAAQGLAYAALEPFDWTRLADALAHTPG
ncbi:NAD(P)-dependent oxidoreductase [Pseudomonas sp. RIT-PI-S]|uniref:NAD(P)-dependent oxidoreductase n=1 Tax=Pseudomonas sp. RIT-PI-S TaxID=3035295 RepID=UPI0021D8801A|nr:NAD(P)-dependent oxidoreductase [Pseudomonas sp. RIT-PI-S]